MFSTSQEHRGTQQAPVAQGIEHRPPEAGAQVRILPGALRKKCEIEAQLSGWSPLIWAFVMSRAGAVLGDRVRRKASPVTPPR